MKLKNIKKIYDSIKNDRMRAFILQLMEIIKYRKDVVRFDTNNVCNIRCIMCNVNHKDLRESRKIMAFDDYKKIIDRIAKGTRLLYLSCGYEPLITPDIAQYIEYAKCKGIPFVSFASNGLLLKPEISEQITDAGLNEIILSFNGFNKSDYNRIMKGSDYDKVTYNLSALKEIKGRKKITTPSVRMNSMLFKSNMQSGMEILDFIDKYNIDTIQFREPVQYDNLHDQEEYEKELLSSLNDNERKALITEFVKIIKKANESNKNIIVPKSIMHDTEFIGYKSESKVSSCSIPFFSYWINSIGVMRSCIYDDKGIIGNILTDSWSDIRKKRRQIRRHALKGTCNRKCMHNINSSEII